MSFSPPTLMKVSNKVLPLGPFRHELLVDIQGDLNLARIPFGTTHPAELAPVELILLLRELNGADALETLSTGSSSTAVL